MTTRNRCLLFAGVTLLAYTGQKLWLSYAQPKAAPGFATQQLNGGAEAFRDLLLWQSTHQLPSLLAEAVVLSAALVCFAPLVVRGLRAIPWKRITPKRLLQMIVIAGITAGFSGCMKPYDKPEYAEIDTSETGFLIPLEGETKEQARFDSVDYLQARKVAAKRVIITHRWNQEGRLSNDGHWMPTVRLVKVNRSPVTCEWTSESKQAGDKAIWIESADSVGFSMGFTCTAFIDEKDAATFLYWYPSGSLVNVMDTEVRARIQQGAAEVAAKYPLDSLRAKKQEIADAVKKDVIAFFTLRGITVTTVGMFGGMAYENPAIQKSIDDTFIAQQLKVVTAAKFEAQQKENERVELEAQTTAQRFRLEAKGRSDARLVEAKTEAEARIAQARAEADAIHLVNEAVAHSGPLLMQIRALDVEKARVERWNGQFPQTMLGSNPNLLFTSPLGAVTEAKR